MKLRNIPWLFFSGLLVMGCDPAAKEDRQSTVMNEGEEVSDPSDQLLDLTLPPEMLEAPAAGGELNVDREPLLPDYFNQQGSADRLSIKGRLLTDEKEEDVLEALEGAEVTVEVKTD